VVRRGDEDRVHFLHLQNAAVVLLQANPAAEPFGLATQVRLVDVTEGNNLHIGVGQDRLQQLPAAVAHADKGNANTAVSPALAHQGRQA
jgi:hypothetical protein